MSKDKSTGKKLADMMYGNPEGAAFGIYPKAGKRSEDKQDREAAKNFPVDLARGLTAGFLGMPADILNFPGAIYSAVTDKDTYKIPYGSEDILKSLPLGSDTPTGQFASGLGTLIGGSANIGPAIRGVKALPGALKIAARNVSAPRTLDSQAGVVRVGRPSAPQMEALRLAQKRAALPIEQGGLGLPANNTPEQRAAAMGFDRDTYHGSLRDIKKLDPRLGSTESHAGRGVYSTDSPEDASLNYASIYGPDVTSRVERGLEERDKDFRKIYGRMRDEVLTPRQQEIILRNAAGADNLGVVYPLKIRADKSIHLDAPEANPVLVGPFEQYDEVADAYVDTPHTEKFREALDEFGELGGEANPIYEVVQDGDGPVPARDVFNAVKKTGNETGLYDPYTGEIVSGGVAAGDFVRHFGIDEIRHTPEFRNQQLNIGNEHTISLNPDNVRSRFAAFDPFRKDAATAAAMGVLAPDLLAKERDEDKKKDKDKEAKKARGGPVHFSDNPDVMQLEMAAGGIAKLAKLARAPAKTKEEISKIAERIAPQVTGEYVRKDAKSAKTVADKTQKQFQREKTLPVDVRPTVEERTPSPIDIEKLKGEVMIGIPGDPTLTGKTLYSVGDVKLGSPSPQHGGPQYGLYNDDAFWASGIGAARRVQNLAKEAGEQYDAPVLGKYIMMGPDSINYAQHFADANLQAIDLDRMTKRQVEQFNKLIRLGNPKSGPRPSFPGIEDKESAYLHMAMDPELRKHFNELMQKNTVTEALNLPSGNDIRFAITEPSLRDLETGVTGFSMGRMRPDISAKDLPLSTHPTYSHDIPGEFMGQSRFPIPYELSFPDTLKSIRENPAQAPHEFGSLKMVGPRQTIDQQMIDEIRAYEERMKALTGKKKGGAVRKAEGGEITADDLILEERKL
jgi:hypothetical protein